MKKKFLIAILLLSILLPAGFVFAQNAMTSDLNSQTGAFAGNRGAGYGEARDPRMVVAYVIQILLSLLGVVFLGYTLYAGFLIMTARGEEEKVTKGKDTLRTAVIGVIIIVSAYTITLLGARIASGGRSDYDKFYREDVGDSSTNDGVIEGQTEGDGWRLRGDVRIKENPDDFLGKDPLE